MERKTLLFLMLAALMTIVVGCGGGSGNKNQGTATSLLIAPGTATVLVDGGTQQFTPTVLNENSKTMTGVTTTWTVSDSTLGTIDSSGKFTAKNKTGTCTITCTAGSLTQTAKVTVGYISDAGKQIINDLESTVEAGKIITETQIQDILSNTNNDVIPHFSQVAQALSAIVNYGCDIELLVAVCTSPTGELSIDSNAKTINGSLRTGTWNVTFTDTSVWKAKYTRSSSNDKDTIIVIITSTDDNALSYQITHSYPTTQVTNYINGTKLSSYSFETSGSLVDSNLANSTLDGEISFSSTDNFADNVTGKFSGALDFKFQSSTEAVNNNYLKFTGDMSLYLTAGKGDYISGTIETADLKISGGLQVDYVANTTMSDGIFPSSMKIEGAVESKQTDDPVTLDGSLTVSISNAAAYNDDLKWSSSNYVQGTINFSGSVRADTYNQIVSDLTFELVSWERYKMTFSVNLTSGGVSRTVSLTFANTDDTHLNFVCESSWGPAVLDVTMTFSDSWETWSDSVGDQIGTLKVNGVQTGVVTRCSGGFKITYNDDTYEELIIVK